MRATTDGIESIVIGTRIGGRVGGIPVYVYCECKGLSVPSLRESRENRRRRGSEKRWGGKFLHLRMRGGEI